MRGTISVTTSSTEIVAEGSKWSSGWLHNRGSNPIYVQFTPESSAVTTSNGFKLAADEKLPILAAVPGHGPAITAIVASGSENLSFAVA